MSTILNQVRIPSKGKTEKDFQKALEKVLLKRNIEFQSKVPTSPLFKDKDGQMPDKWEIDIVIKQLDFYIPVELKFRHGDQEICEYIELFKRDVRRINSLVATYRDIPCGFAVFVTDIVELINNISDIYKEEWIDLSAGYKALIITKQDSNSTKIMPFGIDYIMSMFKTSNSIDCRE